MIIPKNIEELRALIAEVIGEDVSYITDNDSLVDLGLDSIRAMALLSEWRANGLEFETSQFLEEPTLIEWYRLLDSSISRKFGESAG